MTISYHPICLKKLFERNCSLSDQRNENDLKKINKETLDTCEHCLFAIDWTKY